MQESIRIIENQLEEIEHENLCLVTDNNLIADYCKKIRIEIDNVKLEMGKIYRIKNDNINDL